MRNTSMPLGEHHLRIIRFQETKDIPAACTIEVTTVARAVA